MVPNAESIPIALTCTVKDIDQVSGKHHGPTTEQVNSSFENKTMLPCAMDPRTEFLQTVSESEILQAMKTAFSS